MKWKVVLIYIAVTVFALGVGYFAWQLERSWNYSNAYEDKVRDTVKELVKPECLKAP